MSHARWLLGIVVLLLVLPLAVPVSAAPIDTWETYPGIDCVGDRFNPVRPDGTRDPNGDPEPGSEEWRQRDDERLQCARQRDHDRRPHPATVTAHSLARYGEDYYRQPVRFDGQRFRYDYLPVGTGVGEVPAVEV